MTSVPLHDERRFVFALPKGRLGETLDKRLAGTGLGPIPSKENPRALTFPTGDPRVLAVWLKGRDLIRYVARGAATFGVVGSDALGECDDDVLELADLGFGRCTLCLAGPTGMRLDELLATPHLRLATKFSRACAAWLDRMGITAELVPIESSVEIAPRLGLAHAIVDLVQSGDTLRDNDLEVLTTIGHVSARLVMNRGAYLTDREALRAIAARIVEACRTSSQTANPKP
jgi:ATP phosphoribosyltransferase